MDGGFAENKRIIVEELAQRCIEREKQGPDVIAIQRAIQEAKNALTQFRQYQEIIQYYNEAVDRIRALQRAYDVKPSFPFNTRAGQEAYLDAAMARDTSARGIKFKNYRTTRLQNDINLITNLNLQLQVIAIRGYKAITDLREHVTNQVIIYDVQGLESSKVYQATLTENEFLELLSVKPQYNSAANLSKINPENYKGISLTVDFNTIEKEFSRVYSRDPLYLMLSPYIAAPRGQKLRPSEAWEIYSQAKTVFGKQATPSEDVFHEFVGEWLLMKTAKFQRFADAEPTSHFSTLPFYSGGDTTTFSNYVVVQNKNSSSSFREAKIHIKTVYNGLQYIEEVFASGGKVDEEKVKKLFTAYNLRDVPDVVIAEAFLSADKAASDFITRSVAALNGKVS